MGACPKCGGIKRRETAPAFYECLSPASGSRGRESGGDAAEIGLCGERYLDSEPDTGRWLAAAFGLG